MHFVKPNRDVSRTPNSQRDALVEEVLWTPSEARIEQSDLAALVNVVEAWNIAKAWDDGPDVERYRAVCFERVPGLRRRGEHVELTASEGTVISGRSETVPDSGGVRICKAEACHRVGRIPEVLDLPRSSAEFGVCTELV